MVKPASGRGLLYGAAKGRQPIGDASSVRGELERVAPAHQAARVDEPAFAQGVERDQYAWADAQPLGDAIRFGHDTGADRHLEAAD